MENDAFYKKILMLAAVALIFCVAYLCMALVKFNYGPASKPAAEKEITKNNLLNSDIDKTTADCLKKMPVGGNPLTGIIRREGPADNSYSDFFYQAYLKSVEEAKVGNCEAVKITIGQDKDNSEFIYHFYLPKNLPSVAGNKKVLPSQLSPLIGEKIELMARYGIDTNSGEKKSVSGILGWKFGKVLYRDENKLDGIREFYNLIQ
jgi:hypothetical protein